VDQLTAMLERTVDKLKPKAGQPLVAPTPQSKTLRADADALVLHLIARNVTRKGGEDVPHRSKLGETRSIGWGSYPAEDWIILSKAEWAKLLPTGAAQPGTSWELDAAVAAKVLTHFYPSTENNDVSKNRIERQELRATVVSVTNGVARAQLEGRLRMKHPFYHKDDNNYVDARLLGVIDFAADRSRIASLQLITKDAVYGGRPFGVALRTVATPGARRLAAGLE
jgi:hypothetical protein